ncbi:MAG: hypothetical protein AB9836_04965 [Aminipila sp.]
MPDRCFALSQVGVCTILKVRNKYCGTKLCHFYKTESVLKECEENAHKRCETLGISYIKVKRIK